MIGNEIICELMDVARQHPEFGLLQFKTLLSAEQYRKLYELIAKFIKPSSAVLDWGCGNGHVCYALNKMGHRVTGYSLEEIPSLGALLPEVEFFHPQSPDPRKLPYDDQTFDAVLSVGVLEHVRETQGDELSSLREINRVLKPGGVFICYHLPNRYSYLEALSRLLPHTHSHTYRFTREDIEALCSEAALDILSIDRYGLLPRNPWQSLPSNIGKSPSIRTIYQFLDELGRLLLPAIAQNYFFVAVTVRTL